MALPNDIDTTKLYRKMERLINKLCHKHNKRFHSDSFKDYKSVANMLFLEAIRLYDESKGMAFSTWLYMFLDCRLRNHTRQIRRRRKLEIPCDHDRLLMTEQSAYFQTHFARSKPLKTANIILSLKEDAATIATAFLSNKCSTIGEAGTYARSIGIGKKRFNQALDEIKAVLKEAPGY